MENSGKIIPELNKIYQGDCLEIMRTWPDKCVDITVTSPPYNQLRDTPSSGMHKNNFWAEKQRCAYNGKTDEMPEEQYQEWVRNVVAECIRISKGLVWVNHKIRFRDKVGIHPLRFLPFDIYLEVIWNRGGTMQLNSKRYGTSHEVIYGFGKPYFWDDSLNTKCTVWPIAATPQGFDHPCPYPMNLVLPLINSSCPIDGIVFDPFSGTGTTVVAAEKTRRKWIGIEIDPKYCAIAQSRIDAEMAQGKLF